MNVDNDNFSNQKVILRRFIVLSLICIERNLKKLNNTILRIFDLDAFDHDQRYA